MSATSEEMQEMAEALERSGPREMIIAATAMHLAANLLSQAGAKTDSKLRPQIAMLEEMAAAWLRDGGRDPAEFAVAVAAVRRAGETFNALEAIPS